MSSHCTKCNYEIDTNKNFACPKCGEKFWQSKEKFEVYQRSSKLDQIIVNEEENKEFRGKKFSDYIYVFVYFLAFSLLAVIPSAIVIIALGFKLHLECGNNYTPLCHALWTYVLFFISVLLGVVLGFIPYWRQKKYKDIVSYLRRKNENKSTDDFVNFEKFCSKCGSKISKKSQFCSTCGLKFSKKPVTKSCWFALLLISLPIIIFIIIMEISNPETNKVVTSNSPVVNCDEEKSIDLAKKETYIIKLFDKNDRFLGHGSGIAIKDGKTNGLILTNHHVIENVGTIKVWIGWNNTQLLNASVFADYPDQDIAIIRVDYNLPYTADLIDSNTVKNADTVYAIGWPVENSGESSITKGILSRRIKEDGFEIIQTDASINPGNSGGPLVSKCGIVGMNTAKMSWSDYQTPVEGTGYALSSNFIKSITVKK